MATGLEDFMECQHCAIHFTLLAIVPNYSCLPHTFKHILFLNKMFPPRIDYIGLKRGSRRTVVVETLPLSPPSHQPYHHRDNSAETVPNISTDYRYPILTINPRYS